MKLKDICNLMMIIIMANMYYTLTMCPAQQSPFTHVISCNPHTASEVESIFQHLKEAISTL